MTRVLLLCPGAATVAGNPNLPAKIRGAWGRRLAEGASDGALAGGPCNWPAPCAYDLFFNAQGRATSRLEIPKPFVLALDVAGHDLVVSLTLFGVAGDWAGEAADALVRALREGLDGGPERRALAVTSREIVAAQGLDAADLSAGALLRFLSPVALRQGKRLHVEPASLLKSIANRISGLALWQGSALAIDPGALKAETEALGEAAEWSFDSLPDWRRSSKAQNRRFAMRGALGELLLSPPSRSLAVLLRLGAEVHAGSHAALGMGRYQLLALQPVTGHLRSSTSP